MSDVREIIREDPDAIEAFGKRVGGEFGDLILELVEEERQNGSA